MLKHKFYINNLLMNKIIIEISLNNFYLLHFILNILNNKLIYYKYFFLIIIINLIFFFFFYFFFQCSILILVKVHNKVLN